MLVGRFLNQVQDRLFALRLRMAIVCSRAIDRHTQYAVRVYGNMPTLNLVGRPLLDRRREH
ncbi:MAG: hypothetical protein CL724_02470 [Chloroflexi bacterium]|nr:hypothetical protein [Chloroflexota bacterium]